MTNRRTFLKGLGAAGIAGGLGAATLTGTAAAQSSATVTANKVTVAPNDRGDVSEVTINPTFRVEWENFDVAVGKVFYVIEAKVGDNGDWYPIFRSTPWLIPSHQSLKGVQHTKPDTTGYLEFVDPLGDIMKRATEARTDTQRSDTNHWPTLPLPRPLTVADERGRPDYQNVDYSATSTVTGDAATSKEGYLGGNSIGGTPEVIMESATGPNDAEALVNHFPGAASGIYGAAADTSALDNPQDNSTTKNPVYLRYTFELLTVNQWQLDAVGDAVGEGWFAHVEPSDVQSDSQGNSILAMNGEDGYWDLTGDDDGDGNAYSPASQDYGELQAASSHPGINVATAGFNVEVTNEKAGSGVSVDSNTDGQ